MDASLDEVVQHDPRRSPRSIRGGQQRAKPQHRQELDAQLGFLVMVMDATTIDFCKVHQAVRSQKFRVSGLFDVVPIQYRCLVLVHLRLKSKQQKPVEVTSA